MSAIAFKLSRLASRDFSNQPANSCGDARQHRRLLLAPEAGGLGVYLARLALLSLAALGLGSSLQELCSQVLQLLSRLLLLLEVLLQQSQDFLLAHLLGTGHESAVACDLVVLHLRQAAIDESISDLTAGGPLYRFLSVGHEALG